MMIKNNTVLLLTFTLMIVLASGQANALNITAWYTNATNASTSQDIMFLTSIENSIYFNVTIVNESEVEFDWQVNKISRDSNNQEFIFSVPDCNPYTDPTGCIWEIHLAINDTENETHKEWIISNLTINQAPYFFESFTDGQLNGARQSDPWGRNSRSWTLYTGSSFETENLYLKSLIDATWSQIYTTDNIDYGTWKFRYKYPLGTFRYLGGSTSFCQVALTFINSANTRDGQWTGAESIAYFIASDQHDQFRAQYKINGAATQSGISFHNININEAPTGWTSDNNRNWHNITIIRKKDGYSYLFIDDKLKYGGIYRFNQTIPNNYINIAFMNRPANPTGTPPTPLLETYLDDMSFYNETYIFPDRGIRYGSYYVEQRLYGNGSIYNKVRHQGIVIGKQNTTLAEISGAINNQTMFEYYPGNNTAIAHANISILGGSGMIIENSTLMMDTSNGMLEIRPENGIDLRIHDSLITTTSDTPFIWHFPGVLQGYYEGGVPIDSFQGIFIVNNSVINNTGHIILEGATEIRLIDSQFTNLIDPDIDDYNDLYSQYNEFFREQLRGNKAVWFYNRQVLSEFIIDNVTFSGKDNPVNISFIGGGPSGRLSMKDVQFLNSNLAIRQSVNRETNNLKYLPERGDLTLINNNITDMTVGYNSTIEVKYYLDILTEPQLRLEIRATHNKEITNLNPYKTWTNMGTEQIGGTTGGYWLKLYGESTINRITTQYDGHTPSPDNKIETLIITDYTITNNNTGLNLVNYTYNISAYDQNNIWTNVTQTIYPNGTIRQLATIAQLTGIDPNETWYRPNPNTPTVTIELVIPENHTRTNITIGTETEMNITVNTWQPEGAGIKINFTAETEDGNNVNFTVCNLTTSTDYLVKKDTVTFDTTASDTQGCITFNNSAWTEHEFTIEQVLHLNITSWYTNATNASTTEDSMFLASIGDSLYFNITIENDTEVEFDWQVNKISQYNNSPQFIFTVPSCTPETDPSGCIWEIHLKIDDTQNEVYKEWVISNLTIGQAPRIFDYFTDGRYENRTETDPWGRELPEWTTSDTFNASAFRLQTDDGTINIPYNGTKGTWKLKYRYLSAPPTDDYDQGTTFYFIRQTTGSQLGLGNPTDGHWWLDYWASHEIEDSWPRASHSYPYINMVGSCISGGLVSGTSWHDVVFIMDENGYVGTWLEENFVQYSRGINTDIYNNTVFEIDAYGLEGYTIAVDRIEIYENQYLIPSADIYYDGSKIVINDYNTTPAKIAEEIDNDTYFEYNITTGIAKSHVDILIKSGAEFVLEDTVFEIDSGKKLKYEREAIITINNSIIRPSSSSQWYWEQSGSASYGAIALRIINSTIDNTGGFAAQGMKTFYLKDSNFTNMSGTQPISISFRRPPNGEYLIDNCRFIGKTGTERIYLQGGSQFHELIPKQYGLDIIDSVFDNITFFFQYDWPYYLSPGRPLGVANFVNTITDGLSSDGSIYRYKTYLDVLVVDRDGLPLSGVNVTVTNLEDNGNYSAENLIRKWEYLNVGEQVSLTGDVYFDGQQGNWFKGLVDANDMPSTLTGEDGHTPLPSNTTNTIVITYRRSGSGYYVYNITASKYGYSNTTTIYPNSTYYRQNPNTYQNTTLIVLNMKINESPVLRSSSPATPISYDEGTKSEYAVSTDRPVNSTWYVDNVAQSEDSQSFSKNWTYADSGIHNITYIGSTIYGSVSKEWQVIVNDVELINDSSWTVGLYGGDIWSGNITMANVTEDFGDHKIKIGVVADNFDDFDLNEWAYVSGGFWNASTGYLSVTNYVYPNRKHAIDINSKEFVISFKTKRMPTNNTQYATIVLYHSLSENQYYNLYKSVNGTWRGYSYFILQPTSVQGSYTIPDDGSWHEFTAHRGEDGYVQLYVDNEENGDPGYSMTYTSFEMIYLSAQTTTGVGYFDDIRIAASTRGNLTSVTKDSASIASNSTWKQIKYNGLVPDGTHIEIYANSSTCGSFRLVESDALVNQTYSLPPCAQERNAQWRLTLVADNPSKTPVIHNVTMLIAAKDNIPSINVTSVDNDTIEPYYAENSTAYVNFTTNISTDCRISLNDSAYSEMTTLCGTGINHSCSVNVTTGINPVYIACVGQRENDNHEIDILKGIFCGDSICNNGETCSTCACDCGACPSSSSGGSSPSSGGSSGGASLPTTSAQNETDEPEKPDNQITGDIINTNTTDNTQKPKTQKEIAEELIDEVKAIIEQYDGIRYLDDARSRLTEASASYMIGDYENAIIMASEAKELAQNAKIIPLQSNITDGSIINYIISASIAIIIIGIIIIFLKNRNQKPINSEPKQTIGIIGMQQNKLQEIESYISQIKPVIDEMVIENRLDNTYEQRLFDIEKEIESSKQVLEANPNPENTESKIENIVRMISELKNEIENNR